MVTCESNVLKAKTRSPKVTSFAKRVSPLVCVVFEFVGVYSLSCHPQTRWLSIGSTSREQRGYCNIQLIRASKQLTIPKVPVFPIILLHLLLLGIVPCSC
jgi:hypothetical protein